MIRREQHGALLLISQHEHALLAGRLAEHVGNECFERPKPNRAFVRAVGLHDSGWPRHDDRPTINGRGLPIDVFESTPQIALAVWPGAPQCAAVEDPYAGLLVSLHVMALSRLAMSPPVVRHEGFPKEPQVIFEVNKFQHKQVELQEELRRKLGMATDRPLEYGLAEKSSDPREQRLVYHFRLLQALDQISLAACCTKPPMEQTTPLPTGPGQAPVQLALRRDGDDVIVSPWPFDVERIDCRVPCRQVEARAYDDDDELRQAYDKAPTQELRFAVRER